MSATAKIYIVEDNKTVTVTDNAAVAEIIVAGPQGAPGANASLSITTKGDLQGYDSVLGPSRVPVGATDGSFLAADSTNSLGVSYKTLTASRAAATSATGVLVASATTDTELSYLSGVTSSIQTQISSKQASGNYITALTGHVTASGPGSVASTIQAGVITNSMVNTSAAIAYSKLSLTGSILAADIVAAAGIPYSKLTLTGAILNADVSSSAAIAYSKLALSNSILNADISSSAAIAYSKLSLTGSILAADIVAAAGIPYSKLTLTGAILNADISSSAAIAYSKLAALTTGQVLLGNAGTPTATTLTGDVTVGATGITAIGNGKVTNAMLAGSIDLSTKVTSTLAITNGGTGQNTAAAAFDALSPVSTKGDLVVRGTASSTRLGAGTDGFVLTADSSQTLGLKWAVASGSGSSGKNYITNPDAETNTTGWVTFADGAAYVDGTGGSPTGTWTRQTSTILRGVASFQWTAGTLGDGVSYDFTLDVADKAKLQQISFDYQYSGTVATDGSYQVYIYDITNAQIIQPDNFKMSGGVSGVSYTHSCQFQTASNSTSYRVSIYQSVTTPGGNIYADNFAVGPQLKAQGGIATGTKSYIPTITGTTTNPTKGTVNPDIAYYRRVGDCLEIEYSFRQTVAGSAGSGIYLWSLPPGLSIDLTKVTTGGAAPVGDAYAYNGTSEYTGFVAVNDASTLQILIFSSISLSVNVGSANVSLGNATARVGFKCTVPIVGWDTTTTLSSMDTQRLVAASYKISGATAASATVPVNYSVKIYDTHGAVTPSATVWKFTAPAPGLYTLNYMGAYGSGTPTVAVYLNSSLYGYITNTAAGVSYNITGSLDIQMNAGDYIDFRPNASLSTTSSAPDNFISIKRNPNNQTIAASETIAMRAVLTTTQTGITSKVIPFNSATFDSHGGLNVSTGVYTVQSPGYFAVSAILKTDANDNVTNYFISIRKNSSAVSNNYGAPLDNATTSASFKIYDILKCVAGDTIDIFITGDASFDIDSGNNRSLFTVNRIGSSA